MNTPLPLTLPHHTQTPDLPPTPTTPPQVAEAALGAIGALTIACPSVMVDKNSPANRIMKAALQPTAPEPLKLKALSNLIELLRADEAHMLAAQADGGSGGGSGGDGLTKAASKGLGSAAAGGGKSGGRRRAGRKKGAAAAAAEEAAAAAEEHAAVLQTQNGEGDTLSQSSSILQVCVCVCVCLLPSLQLALDSCLLVWYKRHSLVCVLEWAVLQPGFSCASLPSCLQCTLLPPFSPRRLSVFHQHEHQHQHRLIPSHTHTHTPRRTTGKPCCSWPQTPAPPSRQASAAPSPPAHQVQAWVPVQVSGAVAETCPPPLLLRPRRGCSCWGRC
jgi:hypothetical protein